MSAATIHPDALLTVREAFETRYDKSELSKNSLTRFHAYLKLWERFSGNPAIGEISDEHANEFRRLALAEGYSGRTVNGAWADVRSILRFMGPRETGNSRGLGILSRLPYMKPAKVVRQLPRRLSLDQIATVYLACDGAHSPRRTRGVPVPAWWRTLLVLAYFTGLRKADLVGLRRDQFDLQNGLLVFRAQKTGKPAEFPLHPIAVKHVEAIWQPERPLLFHGIRQNHGRLYMLFGEIQERAGIADQFGFHDIRRTAASEVNRVGKGLAPVFLQHVADDVTGQSYLNQMAELAEAIAVMRFPEVFSGTHDSIRNHQQRQAPKPKPASLNLESWRFHPGGFSYRGEAHQLEGRLLRLLKALMTPKPVPVGTLRLAIGGKSQQAGNVRQSIHKLRRHIREAVGLPDDIDPIPCVGRSDELAWQLTVPEFAETEVAA